MIDETQSNESLLAELRAARQEINQLNAKQKTYEQALQVLQNDLGLYRTMFEQSPFGIITTNLDFKILRVNNKFSEMLGYHKDEFIDASPADYTHPDDLEESAFYVDNLIQGHLAYYQIEKRYLRKDGSIFWVMLSVSLVRDTQGKPLYTFGIVEDINERKQVQEQLQASEKRYRSLVEHALVGVVSSTLDGEILYTNQALLHMLGYESLEDYQRGGASNKYKNPVDRDRLIDTIHQTGKANGFELVGLTKQGKEVTVLVNATLEDEIINMTLVDITERKKAQESLQDERNLLLTIINNLPVDIYVKDIESRFILANEATMKTLGVSESEDYLGKDDFDVTPHNLEQAQQNVEIERQITSSGQALINQELTGIDQFGNRRWNLTSKIPFCDAQGEIIGIVGIGMDITDNKLAEEATQTALEREQQTNALKDRFMTMVSHEFRTPLAIIKTSNQILEDYFDRLSEEKRNEQLHRINAQILHLNDMLDNITTIMRSETDPLRFTPEWLDIISFCETIVETFQASIAINHVLKLTAAESLEMIWADDNLLRIIISNLLSNAIKYSPIETEIELEIFQEDNLCTLKVHDNGYGIVADELPYIFDAYHRGEHTESIKGLGLGLKIVKDFVDVHQGHITVESEQGKGTTFILSLPIRPETKEHDE